MSHFGRDGPPDITETYSLLVLNITFRTTADDLFPLFDKYGKVVDVFIPRDRRTGDSRGFAFVRYKYADEAQKAVERLDGRMVDGREIAVQFAKYGPNAEKIQKGKILEPVTRIKIPSRRHRDSYSRDRDNRRSRSRSLERYNRDRYRGSGRDRDHRRRSRSHSYSPDNYRGRGRGCDKNEISYRVPLRDKVQVLVEASLHGVVLHLVVLAQEVVVLRNATMMIDQLSLATTRHVFSLFFDVVGLAVFVAFHLKSYLSYVLVIV